MDVFKPPIPIFRPVVEESELGVGCILWLPPKDAQDDGIKCVSSLCRGSNCGELREGGYNHPVLVIGMWKKMNYAGEEVSQCAVLHLTSYNSTNLRTFLQRRIRRRHLQKKIPVYYPGSEPISQLTEVGLRPLYLEKDMFTKQSYVQTSHIYALDRNRLCRFRAYGSPAYKYRLRRSSYQDLMGRLGLTPQEYVETEIIEQNFRKSHHTNDKSRRRQPPSGNESAHTSIFQRYSGYELSYNKFESTDYGSAYYRSTASHGYLSKYEVMYSSQIVRELDKGRWFFYPVDMWIFTLCQWTGRIIGFLLSAAWFILKWCAMLYFCYVVFL